MLMCSNLFLVLYKNLPMMFFLCILVELVFHGQVCFDGHGYYQDWTVESSVFGVSSDLLALYCWRYISKVVSILQRFPEAIM